MPRRVMSGIRNPCARNSPTATTANAKAKQNLIRVLPKTRPMHRSPSETASFGKRKNPLDPRTIRKRHVVRAVNPLTLARLVHCLATKNDAILARQFPSQSEIENADIPKAPVRARDQTHVRRTFFHVI